MAHQDYVKRSRSANKKKNPYKSKAEPIKATMPLKVKLIGLITLCLIIGFSYALWSIKDNRPSTTTVTTTTENKVNTSPKASNLPEPPKEKWSRWRWGLLLGFISGFVFFALSCHWLVEVGHVAGTVWAGIAALVFFSLYLAIYFALFGAFAGTVGRWIGDRTYIEGGLAYGFVDYDSAALFDWDETKALIEGVELT